MLHRLTTYFKDLLANLKALNENFDWHTEALDRHTAAMDKQNESSNELLLAINENLAGQRALNSMIVNHLIDEKKLEIQKERLTISQEETTMETIHDRAY